MILLILWIQMILTIHHRVKAIRTNILCLKSIQYQHMGNTITQRVVDLEGNILSGKAHCIKDSLMLDSICGGFLAGTKGQQRGDMR